ncbi:ABC transporter ATP-binding protein [uncultured Propionivibrio sp.]|uniref:ABC transporter ATP-binding protein n=1 Tax=uncultured Propionivibrio sp. TaxID=426737 RepID=UPI0029C05DF3|nr:ABC transporter ATP-binding protein [uncultured Propionivibrio sp.]
MSYLAVNNLHVSYGPVQALRGVNLNVEEGSIVSIIGANGAGKTTLLNTLSGIVKPKSGSILFRGKSLPERACRIIREGIAHVPEGRKIFPGFTIEENLLAGAYIVDDKQLVDQRRDAMYARFPILAERTHQQAGTLSGGEQQMLAIARGLMSDPGLILLDEPSLGLAPLVVKAVFELIREIRDRSGKTILLVEQNAKKALALCDYAYVLENGVIVLEGKGDELLSNPAIRKAYLGAEDA